MPFAVLRHIGWNRVEGAFFSSEVDAVAHFRTGSYLQSQMLVSPSGKAICYWGVRQGRDQEMHEWWKEHHHEHTDLHLNILGIAGTACRIPADRLWYVHEAKLAIEQEVGIPTREQRLLHDVSVLHNSQALMEICGDDAEVPLTLVRRDPEQAAWLELVQADNPWELAEAPEKIRSDAEVILAAAAQDDRLVFLAAPSLLADAAFVYTAIRQRDGPTAQALSQAPLTWVRSPADAKLALRAATHLGSQRMAQEVLQLRACQEASEEERVHLASEPCMTPEAAGALLQGLRKGAVQRALRHSSLDNLPLGLRLLELEAAAPAEPVRGGVQLKVPVLPGEVLRPANYAACLFLRHMEHLRSEQGADDFTSLLQHSLNPHVLGTCGPLVRICLAHNRRSKAREFFLAGAEDSEECAALLSEDALPLTLLEKHRLRVPLLSRFLAACGGPREVLAAVAQNRNSLQDLLHRVRGDAAICRSAALREALRLAAERNEEAPGRVLLRAYALATPPALPDFPVPLPWLGELRGAAGCDGLIMDRLLEAAEAASVDEVGEILRGSWGCAEWAASGRAQLDRALRVVQNFGIASERSLAEVPGRDGELLRMDLEDRLTEALAALPLLRLDCPTALCAPGFPPPAMALFAMQRAREAEGKAQEAEAAAQRARERAARAEASSRQLQRDLQALQTDMDGMRYSIATIGSLQVCL